MPIQWRDTMSVGNTTIDSDHKALIAIMNEFEASPDLAHAEAAAKRLFRYTQEHFQREEQMQLLARFPGAPAHHKEHEALLARLKTLIKERFMVKIDPADAPLVLAEMNQLFKDWIIGHVIQHDIQLKPYLGGK